MTAAADQRARLARKRRRGECIRCPEPASPGAALCAACREAARLKWAAKIESHGGVYKAKPSRRLEAQQRKKEGVAC